MIPSTPTLTCLFLTFSLSISATPLNLPSILSLFQALTTNSTSLQATSPRRWDLRTLTITPQKLGEYISVSSSQVNAVHFAVHQAYKMDDPIIPHIKAYRYSDHPDVDILVSPIEGIPFKREYAMRGIAAAVQCMPQVESWQAVRFSLELQGRGRTLTVGYLSFKKHLEKVETVGVTGNSTMALDGISSNVEDEAESPDITFDALNATNSLMARKANIRIQQEGDLIPRSKLFMALIESISDFSRHPLTEILEQDISLHFNKVGILMYLFATRPKLGEGTVGFWTYKDAIRALDKVPELLLDSGSFKEMAVWMEAEGMSTTTIALSVKGSVHDNMWAELQKYRRNNPNP